MESYNCTPAADIHVCAMLIHFINSGGTHPYGDGVEDIMNNIELQKIHFKLNSLDILDILNHMLHSDPLKRPTISEVYK